MRVRDKRRGWGMVLVILFLVLLFVIALLASKYSLRYMFMIKKVVPVHR